MRWFALGAIVGFLFLFVLVSAMESRPPTPRMRDDCKILIGCAGYQGERQLVLCPS